MLKVISHNPKEMYSFWSFLRVRILAYMCAFVRACVVLTFMCVLVARVCVNVKCVCALVCHCLFLIHRCFMNSFFYA
jgi:hypothetical protein